LIWFASSWVTLRKICCICEGWSQNKPFHRHPIWSEGKSAKWWWMSLGRLLFPTKMRVHIAGSVTRSGRKDFRDCVSLNEVKLSTDSRVREIAGFFNCSSFCWIEVPFQLKSSVNHVSRTVHYRMKRYLQLVIICTRFKNFSNVIHFVELRFHSSWNHQWIMFQELYITEWNDICSW
jgi:hypothetical protein